MEEIIKYAGCFVCGDKNPHGLQIRFFSDGDRAVAEYTADPRYQGYRGVFHGGMISTLLDEIMAKAVLARRRYCMTAEMTVRFRRVIPVGEKLRLIGHVTAERGRIMETSGEIVSVDGDIFATATGKYLDASSKIADLMGLNAVPAP